MEANVKPRERDAILQALQAGVVPRLGLPYLQVGRKLEVSAVVGDVERLVGGGAAVRFVIGEYGAGKTFFLNLVRSIAHEKRCVTIHADLAPERRIYAAGGQARSLYQEAVRNMSTRAKPDGGALAGIVEKFISECVAQAGEDQNVDAVVEKRLAHLHEFLGGHDYATVLKAYWKGSRIGDEHLKENSLRWLRGEYSTKTEARADLGVRTIIDDSNVYDSIKLLSEFVRLAKYEGLVVIFDEMVNIYKVQNSDARNKNYEQLLRITNDVLQGNVKGLGFLFGGTPEFLLDGRRGVYSYEALKSRLQENPFAGLGVVDVSGPVLRLQNLTTEELLILLQKIRGLFSEKIVSSISDEMLIAFMQHCSKQIGESYFRTPRNTIKTFIQLLSVLDQNSHLKWQDLIGEVKIEQDTGVAVVGEDEEDDELTSIQL